MDLLGEVNIRGACYELQLGPTVTHVDLPTQRSLTLHFAGTLPASSAGISGSQVFITFIHPILST